MSRLFGNFVGGWQGLSLLVLRLVVGAAFVLHGLPKMENAFGWMDRPGAHGQVPALLQAAAALSEFGGGIALLLGLLTPLAALGIGCTMTVALGLVHIRHFHPFVSTSGGPSCELAAVYLSVAILVLLTGPGAYSLDALLFGRGREETPKGLSIHQGKKRMSEVA